MGLPAQAKDRKAIPIATGVIDYFPDAIAAIAKVSVVGNEQHHPGEPLHWDKSKSTDEADALMRHFIQRGTIDIDGIPHSTKVAWRAMALLQRELENDLVRINLVGQKIGKRLVLALVDKNSSGHAIWRVRCDCGLVFDCLTQSLQRRGDCRNCSTALKADRPNRRKRPYETLYNTFKQRSRHKVVLTYEDFVSLTEIDMCHYCNATIIWHKWGEKSKGGRITTASNLDRKDNTGDYSLDNVVVCCPRCNKGKNALFSYSEWCEIGKTISNMNEKRALAMLQEEIEVEAGWKPNDK